MTTITKREIFANEWNIVLAALAVVIIAGFVAIALIASPQTPSQKTFTSPAAAAQTLYSAAKKNDMDELRLIFGAEAAGLLSSGDPVEDRNNRERAVKKYEEMHRLVTEPDYSVKLYLGAENWPFPIPLVQKNGVWLFDTAAGKKEILFRRIGRNEFNTIDTLNALVEAQKEYASTPRGADSVKQYAQKILSDEGKQNGLYWKPSTGEPASPIGPLIAVAAKEGYRRSKEGPTPFHGYIYRVLRSQGRNAPGGAISYMSNGKMTRGFAFLAYPATYRNSGVMTFIVNRDGVVYQKDLGPRTATIAQGMTQYNPDKTWTIAE